MTKEERAEIRQAVADYMRSEGCGCCRDHAAHEKHAARLAKLLRVQQYADSSGFDFPRYRSKTSEPNGPLGREGTLP